MNHIAKMLNIKDAEIVLCLWNTLFHTDATTSPTDYQSNLVDEIAKFFKAAWWNPEFT